MHLTTVRLVDGYRPIRIWLNAFAKAQALMRQFTKNHMGEVQGLQIIRFRLPTNCTVGFR